MTPTTEDRDRPAPGPAGAEAAPAGLHALLGEALAAFAAAGSLADLDTARVRWLGRGDGLLSAERRRVGAVADPEARRALGQVVNEVVRRAEEAVAERRSELDREAAHAALAAEALDLTRPAPPLRRGRLHPVTQVTRELRRVMGGLGYAVVEGPEVEYDRYNFELVNMPPNHPARDTQDTFFIDDTRVLRTHTSPVQIRAMRRFGAPLRVIVPGRAYRRDYDATHFPTFHQCEGICIDEGISLGDLKGTLLYLARSLFGPDRAIRLRPHHFPFTEPSLEVDVSCMVCDGAGCPTCRRSGWIELLGSGMVHPDVLANGGIDPDRYSGFAFGIGLERIAMLRWDIHDGRLLYENDLRFLHPA